MKREEALTPKSGSEQREQLYAEAAAAHAPSIVRLARAVERDADKARDLEQDIHLALWRSLEGFAGDCALATWTYRVAHNVAASHAAKGARGARLVTLDEIDTMPGSDNPEQAVGEAQLLSRLHAMIQKLRGDDRSVILLYLEGLGASEIAAITGLSTNHVGVKIHRIKAVLTSHFASGEQP